MASRKQSRRDFLKNLGLGTSALALGSWGTGARAVRPTNVVIILTDDQGYADVGRYGARGIPTPNLDRMASEGVTFTSFYVSEAVCSASRASLLTGCYAERVSIQGALMPWSTIGLNPEEETIADILRNEGYATGIVGKWHLGHHKEFLPLQHGFDEYFGLPYSNDMWPVDYDGKPLEKKGKSSYPPLPLIEGNQKVSEIRTLDDQNQLTTLYTQRVLRFIENNKDRPFFLYFPHSMPHVPLGVSGKFRGKSVKGLYGDVIMEIDWSVGEIMQALKKFRLDENTLVIFTSDNGPWLNFGNHAGSALPLREGKGAAWEGGVRVPCIMRWPGRIPEGIESRQIASTIDLLPTIASITGASLPKNPIDGISILSVIEGKNEANPRETFFFYYDGELQAVRLGEWKLHFPHRYRSYVGVEPGKDGHPGPYATGTTGLELYNLEMDIGERTSVADKHPDIVARLKELGDVARKELGDSLTGVKGRGVRPPGRAGSGRKRSVRNLALGKTITFKNLYHSKYPGRGATTLIDGERGTLDHTDGAWQGFEQVDIDARIDLGEPTSVHRVTVGFLENQSAWIFLPSMVEIAVSVDGTAYQVIDRIPTAAQKFNPEPRTKDVETSIPPLVPVRYLRIKATNIGTCPSWHPGAEGKAWIFADEIVLE